MSLFGLDFSMFYVLFRRYVFVLLLFVVVVAAAAAAMIVPLLTPCM